jgi:hypothetical protein
MIGIFCSSGIELQDGGRIEDEDARAIGLEPQVDTIGLLVLTILSVIDTFRQWVDFWKTVGQTVDEIHIVPLRFIA